MNTLHDRMIDKAIRIREVATGLRPITRWVPFDLETTVWAPKSGPVLSPMPYGTSTAHPFAGGYGEFRFYVSATDIWGTTTALDEISFFMKGAAAANTNTIVCGHNLKFDFQHMPEVPPELLIWDTMVAEYILTGQQTKMISLAELAARYRLLGKADLIGESLAKGVTPDQIPKDELMRYLDNDLTLVEAIAKKQWARAVLQGQAALILSQGDATLVYAMAERNGMSLDVPLTIKRRDYHEERVDMHQASVVNYVRTLCAVPLGVADEELVTPRLLSMAFFGVPRNIKVSVPLAPGAPRRANQKYIQATLEGCPSAKALYADTLGMDADELKTGNKWLKTDDVVLNKIIQKFPKSLFAEFAAEVLGLREHTKLLNTYYQKMLEHASAYDDATIHHTINQCIAHTGRTTSEKPNGQNMPPAVRECIVAPNESGGLLEVDFRQLEICALAQLSGDPALISAIVNGEDIHYLTGQLVYGYKSKADETPERRRIIKTINFGLAYGGGAYTLAEQAGVDVRTARNVIEAFYRRFPGTRQYNDAYLDQVANRPMVREVLPPDVSLPLSRRVHTMSSLTGRRYVYTEEKTPAWLQAKTGALVTFAPTQTKNYPVQGFATGDIVPLAVGMLMRHEGARGCIRNVVHDSVLLSYEDDNQKAELLAAIEAMVTALPAVIKTLWDIVMKVPLRTEIKEGENWGTMHALPDCLE